MTPPFSFALESLALKFVLRGTQLEFQAGKYEGHLITTAPLHKRRGRSAGPGEVMAFLSFLPSSLTAVLVKFIYPSPAAPSDTGVVIEGDHAGVVVDINHVVAAENMLMGSTRTLPREWVHLSPLNVICVRK